MPIVELLIGLSIAYVLFYGLMNHVLRRRSGDGREESSATTAVPRSQPSTVREARRQGSRTTSTVVCRVCGIGNEAGYTYCRNCVVELDGF